MSSERRVVKAPLARWILRRVVGEQEADVVEGELGEGFQLRVEQRGTRGARSWYRSQVWGYVWRAASVRRLAQSVRGGETMGFDELGRDLRWALRSIWKRPAFSVVAVATLALGIGANSAIFTLVQAHFFEALPYDDPEDLVLLWETGRNDLNVTTVTPGNYWTWREEASSFSDVAAYNVAAATLSGDGAAERVTASVVAPHFFDVLGVSPLLGGGFSEASVRDANELQVVLAHSLWMRRYGGDEAIVGRDIRVNGRPHTVLGVLPPEFRQPERSLSWQKTELWRPMLLDEEREDFNSRYLRTIARLNPGVTVEQARDQMQVLAERMAEAQPEANGGRSILVRTLDEYLMGESRPTLIMLLAAGAAVLLIVCANVANLTLARGEERRREFAVRAALGSGRGRLLRQVLVEGVVLATLGAAVGTAFVYVGDGVLQTIQARFFSGLIDISVDGRLIAVSTLVALGAGVLSGFPLARSAARPDLQRALTEGGERSGGTVRSEATRNVLIVGQVGLATTLLVVAALLSRSFNELVQVAPGFEPEGIVTFTASPPSSDYSGTEEVISYHRRLLDEVQAIPSVAGVGIVSDLMFTTENMSATFTVDGLDFDPERPPRAEFHVVVPEYFGVLGIPVVEGTLPERWAQGEEMPVVVNQRMAETYWSDGSAVGAGIYWEGMDPAQLRVVAVVGNVLDDGYAADAGPTMYVPFAMAPQRSMAYAVEAVGDEAFVMDELRQAVARIDPDIPAGDLRLLQGMMAESVARPRAASLIGMTFALLALLVSAAGIYGVLSYAVQSRTREIGIRAALGADGGQLVRMVMGHSSRLVLVGLGLGVLGSLAAGRALSGLLFGVQVWDPASLAGSMVTLGLVATLAAWIPARRAVAIDPKEALRDQ